MTVRTAKLEDADSLVRLLGCFHAEGIYANSPLKFCKYTMMRTVLGFLKNMPETYCQVVERGGRVVGLMLADIFPVPFADAKFSRVAFLYIHPKFRGGIAAFRMIKGYVKWAKSKGVLEILGGTQSGVSPRKTISLYERSGFKEAGYTMRLEKG